MWARIKRGLAWKGEVKLIRKNGSVIWAEAVISPLRRKNERSSGHTVFYQGISKRKHFEKLSMRDELTGLFNRRYFNEVASLLLAKARREQQLFVKCILDVDNFKQYIDTYGHPAGNKVLKTIGKALTPALFRRGIRPGNLLPPALPVQRTTIGRFSHRCHLRTVPRRWQGSHLPFTGTRSQALAPFGQGSKSCLPGTASWTPYLLTMSSSGAETRCLLSKNL